MFRAAQLWGSLFFSSSTWDTNPGHLQEERRQHVRDTVHVVRGLSQVSEKKEHRKTATEPPLSLSICFLLFLRIHFPCLSAPRFSYSLFERGLRSLGFSPKFPGKDSSQPACIGCSGWDYEVPQAALVPGPRDADIWPPLCLPGWHMVQGWR